MTLHDEQIAREESSVTRGVERVMTQVRKDQDKNREFDNGPGGKLVTTLVENSVGIIRRIQRQSQDRTLVAMGGPGHGTGKRVAAHDIPVTCLPADVLTFITIKTMLNASNRGWTVARVGQIVGDLCETEFKWGALRKAESQRLKEGEGPGYNRIKYLKQEVKAINPRSVKKWIRRLEDLEVVGWGALDRAKVGLQLVNAVLDGCPDVFDRVTDVSMRGGHKVTRTLVAVKKEARDNLASEIRRLALDSPWQVPMISAPAPWASDALGGYLTPRLKVDMVKPMNGRAYEGEVPDVVIDAVNAVQSTPWVINERVLEIAKQAHEIAEGADQDHPVHGVLPVKVWLEQLPEVPAEEWEAMPKEDQAAVRARRKEIYDDNFRLEAKRAVVSRQMGVAEECAGNVIYFPHNLDFRGRMYPLPQDLHPQADDFGKSLLMFAEGKPLGQRGFEWLCYTLAGEFGQDKIGLDERMEWVFEHQDQLRALADDPLANLEFWTTADSPWQGFAAAIAFRDALEFGLDHECQLPISVDGSCNGLQHLSAMGRDAVGAKAVNLMAGDRQDIYQIVADKVAGAVEQDSPWHGKVTRAIVKRGVMTKPYGLTRVGMREHLIKDRGKSPAKGGWKHVEGDWRKNADYMRDLMATSIEETVEASVKIMDWMQDVARLLANAGAPTRWVAPNGFEVTQRYCKSKSRVYTIIGVMFRDRREVSLSEISEDLWVTKQVQSVAPNIVHSFDAAHMQAAVARAAAEGITDSFLAVHDSFGCHACDMDAFLDIIKVEFINIYEADTLQDLYIQFQAQAPEGVVIPPPPQVGSFNVADVANSDWFFA